MYTRSNKTLPFISRLASLGLLTLALLGIPKSAQAVSMPSSGSYEFTLYEDALCAGTSYAFSDSATTADLKSAGVGLYGDVGSSWSFCNNTTKTALITVGLYSGIEYTGTLTLYVARVPAGQCSVKTQLSSDNSVGSFNTQVWLE